MCIHGKHQSSGRVLWKGQNRVKWGVMEPWPQKVEKSLSAHGGPACPLKETDIKEPSGDPMWLCLWSGHLYNYYLGFTEIWVFMCCFKIHYFYFWQPSGNLGGAWGPSYLYVGSPGFLFTVAHRNPTLRRDTCSFIFPSEIRSCSACDSLALIL